MIAVPRLVYPYPRDWLVTAQKDRFGRQASLNWRTPKNALEATLIRAAQRQHSFARGIRSYRDGNGQTTADLAEATGMSEPTVRAILNGSRHASIAALFALADAVQADLNLTFGRTRREGT